MKARHGCTAAAAAVQAVSLTASGSPVGSRQLPPATVEQLEAFFDKQLAQVSGWCY
jgi:hypothetical protein